MRIIPFCRESANRPPFLASVLLLQVSKMNSNPTRVILAIKIAHNFVVTSQ
jgi:hypothetical protein